MIVSAAEMRALEEAAFARGVSPEALMDQAGERAAAAVRDFFPTAGVCLCVFGKGNNGGDALVAARHLAAAGWETHLIPAFAEGAWNELVQKKFGECGLAHHHGVGELAAAAQRREHWSVPLVILDGLLGVGARGDLRPEISAATRAINSVRDQMSATVFALDLPTGVEADHGTPSTDAVQADVTLTIGAAKAGLLADGAVGHVGRLVVIPLDELRSGPAQPAAIVATPLSLAGLLPRRKFDVHKGDCGRIAVVAGSPGLTGAAVLCSAAAVRAGAGLVSLYVLPEAHALAAAASIPEVMVRPIQHYREVLDRPFSTLALGPGLGQEHSDAVRELLRKAEVPAVVDADGLNILSKHLEDLADQPGPRLLTPHPGEMKRLVGDPGESSRAEQVQQFIAQHPVTLLLKGSRTVIGEKGRPLSYNATGHPGMATGGMGDVLTGVCAALLGQQLSAYDAARVGAWVCGRAAELAIRSGEDSQESLCASSILKFLGPAFHALRQSWI